MSAITWWLLCVILGGLGVVIDGGAVSLRRLPFFVVMQHLAETPRRFVGETPLPQLPVSTSTYLGWPVDRARVSVCATQSSRSPWRCRRAAAAVSRSAGEQIYRAEHLTDDPNALPPRKRASWLESTLLRLKSIYQPHARGPHSTRT